jgi:hypothetical protein
VPCKEENCTPLPFERFLEKVTRERVEVDRKGVSSVSFARTSGPVRFWHIELRILSRSFSFQFNYPVVDKHVTI